MINFRKIAQANREIGLFQDNVDQAFKQVNDEIFIGGKLLEDIVVAGSGNFKVKTGLGRRIRGYVTVKADVNVLIFSDPGDDAEENQGIATLNASGACTISLWVF